MLKSLGILLLFAIISLLEIRQLATEKKKKEIVLFSILMGLNTLVAILKINNIPIPNPLDLIAFTLHPIAKLFS